MQATSLTKKLTQHPHPARRLGEIKTLSFLTPADWTDYPEKMDINIYITQVGFAFGISYIVRVVGGMGVVTEKFHSSVVLSKIS